LAVSGIFSVLRDEGTAVSLEWYFMLRYEAYRLSLHSLAHSNQSSRRRSKILTSDKNDACVKIAWKERENGQATAYMAAKGKRNLHGRL